MPPARLYLIIAKLGFVLHLTRQKENPQPKPGIKSGCIYHSFIPDAPPPSGKILAKLKNFSLLLPKQQHARVSVALRYCQTRHA